MEAIDVAGVPSRAEQRRNDLTGWEKEFEQSGRTNQELLGQLISGGASIANYSSKDSEGEWKPSVYEVNKRKMLKITEFGHIAGLRLGVETIQTGLKHAIEIRGSSSMKAEKLFMVPYFSFTKDSKVDERGTNIYLFNDKQVGELKGLILDQPSKG